ncbi:histidine kinase [Marichromatium purpuratum 984]|uniref:histidine kinase n=1 Tax=Marichromatium purpuratum 984 TaxID=765910 RepID=W0E7J4_MARPU|nr:response regulator [Marichromatium purpuratum]AHF05169.1 histidine kinase [Marichromatium purpuratum 984]
MKTILIVDDAPENILVLGKRLMRDFEVLAATSGEEALQLAHAQRPALILLDVKMPGMDGYEVLARLKQDAATQTVPVIFVTAANTAESETDALRSGAADFIHKPVNLEVLESRIALQLALKEQEQALLALNDSLERKVTERTRELQLAKEAAETANSAKSNFLHNMSHEMRTPVHQIVGLLQLVQSQPDSPKRGTWIDQVIDSAHRLTDLFDAILRVTDLDSRMLAIHPEPLAPATLVEEVVAPLRTRIRAKGLTVETRLATLDEPLNGDAEWIRHALHCYLDNAIRFTEHGGIEIAMNVEERSDEALRICFTVTDTGVGFGPEVRARLFSLFEQADNSMSRRHEGSGLGLVTVKKIAERFGGGAGCSSEPGKGSTFWFTVRLGRGRVGAPPVTSPD